MRVMIDSNVIVSAVYNQDSKPATVLSHVCDFHTLILCDYIVKECLNVVGRKFPQQLPVLHKLFASLGYQLITTPLTEVSAINPKDSPILNAAILSDTDIIISGDKHFLSLDIGHPTMLSPTQYFEQYISG